MGAQVSIERLFEQIRLASPSDVHYEVLISPYPSKGILPRLRNLLAARKQAGVVNHIVGDVHYLALALNGKGSILTIHDCAPLNRLKGVRREILRLLWFEWPARRVQIITTISESSRQELVQWLSPALHSKIRVIHNCVRDEFKFHSKPFNTTQPVLLQVGTGWNKNLERVAQALTGMPCRLEIVGPIREHQLKILRDCKIEYVSLGKLDNAGLVAAYQRCDILVFASLYEGFGLPILEAQATGRPVITSNRGPMPEVAGRKGALFVDPENVDSLKHALQRLFTDEQLRSGLVAAGLANVEKFQASRIAMEYAFMYRQVAESTVLSHTLDPVG